MAIVNKIEFIEISSGGGGADFGDLASIRANVGACSNTTRGVCGGGRGPSGVNIIEHITIASTGNGTNFGDLTVARK